MKTAEHWDDMSSENNSCYTAKSFDFVFFQIILEAFLCFGLLFKLSYFSNHGAYFVFDKLYKITYL